MRANSIGKCAVGAMLFGGTLGAASTAQAGLVFTNPSGSLTVNFAYNEDPYSTSNTTGFSATTVVQGDLNVAWSATTGGGFSTTVTRGAGTSFYNVGTSRTFSVTGTEEISFSWSGSQMIEFGLVSGSGYTTVPGLGAGWVTAPPGFSTNDALSGWVTVTLNAGDYWIRSTLGNGATSGPSSFNFMVPAPGAVALLGVAGLVGSRRRRT